MIQWTVESTGVLKEFRNLLKAAAVIPEKRGVESIELGVASFDRTSGLLRQRSGEESVLRPQSARLLAELARTPGAARSKDELIEAIWGDVVVTDDSLTQCVADIRRALGQDGRHILQTLPRFGYRLTVPAADGSASEVVPLDDAPIRFATSADGARLAWTASGTGPPMLKAPSWISNIEMEARSLIFTEFYRWLGERVRLGPVEIHREFITAAHA